MFLEEKEASGAGSATVPRLLAMIMFPAYNSAIVSNVSYKVTTVFAWLRPQQFLSYDLKITHLAYP